MLFFRKKGDDLFTPDHIGGGYLEKRDGTHKFWNSILVAIFILLAIVVTAVVIQAAF